MQSPAALLEELAKRITDRENVRPGAIAWCHHCSRKHPRRQPCKLFRRTRVVNNRNRRGRRADRPNRRVKRWVA